MSDNIHSSAVSPQKLSLSSSDTATSVAIHQRISIKSPQSQSSIHSGNDDFLASLSPRQYNIIKLSTSTETGSDPQQLRFSCERITYTLDLLEQLKSTGIDIYKDLVRERQKISSESNLSRKEFYNAAKNAASLDHRRIEEIKEQAINLFWEKTLRDIIPILTETHALAKEILDNSVDTGTLNRRTKALFPAFHRYCLWNQSAIGPVITESKKLEHEKAVDALYEAVFRMIHKLELNEEQKVEIQENCKREKATSQYAIKWLERCFKSKIPF